MSYRHLNAQERVAIFYLRQMRWSFRAIGRRLGRHHTTIAREFRRNAPRYSIYWYGTAEEFAKGRRAQPRHRRRASHSRLVSYVHAKLAEQWSPELISARLRVDHPRTLAMRISAECIYQWLFNDALHGGQLYQHLRRRHRRRKVRCVGRTRGLIRNRIGIEHRPAGANNRSRYGHWEGDTVEGKKGTGSVATYVERKSRYLVSFKLSGKQSVPLSESTISALAPIPARLRRTMTLDNGKEFAAFEKTDQALKMKTFFANPHAPWERGTNENTNGLLRQYFPKGIDWSHVSDDDLACAVEKLNNRPRKCLAYRSPLEVLDSIGCGAVGS